MLLSHGLMGFVVAAATSADISLLDLFIDKYISKLRNKCNMLTAWTSLMQHYKLYNFDGSEKHMLERLQPD